MTSHPAPSRTGVVTPGAVWCALVVVYIAWGSTYLGIRIVVEDMPPLLSAAARFLTAATLMGTFLAVRSGPRVLRVRPREARGAAIVGILLLAGATAAWCWASARCRPAWRRCSSRWSRCG